MKSKHTLPAIAAVALLIAALIVTYNYFRCDAQATVEEVALSDSTGTAFTDTTAIDSSEASAPVFGPVHSGRRARPGNGTPLAVRRVEDSYHRSVDGEYHPETPPVPSTSYETVTIIHARVDLNRSTDHNSLPYDDHVSLPVTPPRSTPTNLLPALPGSGSSPSSATRPRTVVGPEHKPARKK
jgi:hypothetical protein